MSGVVLNGNEICLEAIIASGIGNIMHGMRDAPEPILCLNLNSSAVIGTQRSVLHMLTAWLDGTYIDEYFDGGNKKEERQFCRDCS